MLKAVYEKIVNVIIENDGSESPVYARIEKDVKMSHQVYCDLVAGYLIKDYPYLTREQATHLLQDSDGLLEDCEQWYKVEIETALCAYIDMEEE